MDRGNHDLNTDVHGKLVMLKDFDQIDRGDIIYYKTIEQNQISRVIGLKDETIEIIDGQVYIDNKPLNTFYGVATSFGLTKDNYFKKMDKENYNKERMKDFFNTSMKPVLAEEGTVFVLVDTWWR